MWLCFQGQNFICRLLLKVTKECEEDSFWACVGMMHHFGLLGIICPGMPALRLKFFQMNHLIMWHLPKLFQHFHENEVEAELYATSWFITLLSDGALLQVCMWWLVDCLNPSQLLSQLEFIKNKSCY